MKTKGSSTCHSKLSPGENKPEEGGFAKFRIKSQVFTRSFVYY